MDGNLAEQFRQWLLSNNRSRYTTAFNSIVSSTNSALSWCDMEDLVAIFSSLKENSNENVFVSVDELSTLLSGLSVDNNQ
jgi:hypothetical protein